MDDAGSATPTESVAHARAVIAAANTSAGAPFAPGEVTSRRTEHASVLVGPFRDGIVVTVTPRRGPSWLLEGATALLYPAAADEFPVCFGLLDGCGQLRVSALADVPHTIELHPPWWLEDDLCVAVRGGHVRPALVESPAVVPLPPAPSPITKLVAGTVFWQRHGPTVRYRSAHAALEFTVMRSAMYSVVARLTGECPPGLAAVFVGRPSLKEASPAGLRSYGSRFSRADARGRWHTSGVECGGVRLFGAHAQPLPPKVPSTRAVPVRPPLVEALASDAVRERRVAAACLRSEILEAYR